MNTEKTVLLLVVMWTSCPFFAYSTSHWDLEGENRTCEGTGRCAGDQIQLTSSSIGMDRNCQCDQQCAIYGDCCPDSEYFNLPEQRRGVASFSCVKLRDFGGIYMRTTCPPDWGEATVRIACESNSSLRDPLSGFPATDLRTGVTYRNLFCAICHRVEELDVWQPRLECPSIYRSSSLTSQNISTLLYFNEDRRSWGLDLNDGFHSCSIDPSIPGTLDKLIRRCIPDVIETCAENWTKAEVRTRCEAYTIVVYDSDNVYRNLHCAACNNIPSLDILQCFKISYKINFGKENNPSAFSVLFDLKNGPPGKIQPCNDFQLFDPFFKRCRSMLTELQESIAYLQSIQEPIPDLQSIREPNQDQMFNRQFYNSSTLTTLISKCTKFMLDENEYVLRNNTVYVVEYKKIFRRGEFNIVKGGGLEICSENIGVKFVPKFDKYMILTTSVGLGISVVFLLMHLTAFYMVSELRNLPGKNLASLCVALLMGYVSFMIGQVVRGNYCIVIAVMTFYSFLASFMWMLTIAFDVWYALRLSTTELRRLSARKKKGKFIIYSLLSWLLPATIVMMALWVELSPGIAVDWHPGFAISSCWFGRSKPLLIFFVIPLALVMIFNITFFSNSAYMIYSTSSNTRSYFKSNSGPHRDFKLYLRLAVMMGLTWIMGLVAGTLDINLLWYIFVILNTLQGLFIFLSFTWNDKVIRGLAICGGTKAPVTPDTTNKKSHIGTNKIMDTCH